MFTRTTENHPALFLKGRVKMWYGVLGGGENLSKKESPLFLQMNFCTKEVQPVLCKIFSEKDISPTPTI